MSAPTDRHEREADHVADRVMRMPEGASLSQRPRLSDDAGVSRSPSTSDAGHGGEHLESVVAHGTRGGGQPLDAQTRAFMEPRFGESFGDVRVHTGAHAAQSASSIGAAAYTVGRDIVFGAQNFEPHSPGGRRLLAHELTHTVQQGNSGATQVSRTAARSRFSCAANTNGAPATPFDVVDTADQRAVTLANATSILCTIASVLDPSTGTTALDQAYQTRFGVPQSVRGRFRNRFNGQLHATRAEAAQAEISTIGDRLSRISTFLSGAIRYTCHPQGVAFNHSNCTSTCRADSVAFSCVPADLRRIELCPGFWTLTDAQQAIAIIHEAGHMLFDFRNHGSGSAAARASNPECYASFVADTFNIVPFDTRCPP